MGMKTDCVGYCSAPNIEKKKKRIVRVATEIGANLIDEIQIETTKNKSQLQDLLNTATTDTLIVAGWSDIDSKAALAIINDANASVIIADKVPKGVEIKTNPSGDYYDNCELVDHAVENAKTFKRSLDGRKNKPIPNTDNQNDHNMAEQEEARLHGQILIKQLIKVAQELNESRVKQVCDYGRDRLKLTTRKGNLISDKSFKRILKQSMLENEWETAISKIKENQNQD
ncbi:hypothetical protein [Terasakiella pusilla]|uniref:hypothetical protein n=1 Tax=Terasakiella pusilla TaxID=64973 RepID=UPI00048EEFF1|nr:hypothetical protein [Terasakiella pusilla]